MSEHRPQKRKSRGPEGHRGPVVDRWWEALDQVELARINDAYTKVRDQLDAEWKAAIAEPMRLYNERMLAAWYAYKAEMDKFEEDSKGE